MLFVSPPTHHTLVKEFLLSCKSVKTNPIPTYFCGVRYTPGVLWHATSCGVSCLQDLLLADLHLVKAISPVPTVHSPVRLQGQQIFDDSRNFLKCAHICARLHGVTVGGDSLVIVATYYGLHGSWIGSRCGAKFFAPVQTGPGTHIASCTVDTGSFPGKSGRGVPLTTKIHPAPGLK